MTHASRLALVALLTAPVLLAGCRGMRSDSPPVHPNLNMDFQERFEEQEANPFFADDAAMRPVVPGTVRRGGLRTSANTDFFQGRSASGAYTPTIPVRVTPALLERGQERYNIYCTPCHGYAGAGDGVIMEGNGGTGYGYVAAPSYHQDYLRVAEDGYLYEVIANGVRSMPSYGHEVAPVDRWAIVAYIRALQRSQAASVTDVPEAELQRIRTENANVTIVQ